MEESPQPLEFWPPDGGWQRGALPAGTKFIARLEFKGPRTAPVFNGYRPNWWLGRYHEGHKAYNDAQLLLVGRDEAMPGETVEIALQPVFPNSGLTCPKAGASRCVKDLWSAESRPSLRC